MCPSFARGGAAALLLVTGSLAETLHNGIQLPDPWPPRLAGLTRAPAANPPYLEHPPAVIPIDVGRQLFVDDFLVAQSTLTRTFHRPMPYPGNPVLRPDRPWEMEGGHPCAMVFSDGVWYDPADQLFKMWYMGGYVGGTCYAYSADGVHWTKPELDIVAGTNIVEPTRRDSGTVWLDLFDPDPARRYKLFIYAYPEGSGALTVRFSADGLHWSDPVARSGPCGDRSTVFYNPFRGVWVYGIRNSAGEVGRCRSYWEHRDVLEAARWEGGQALWWVGADDGDPPRDDLRTPCQLYNLDAVAYESLLLGLFSIWRGQPGDRPKPNDIVAAYSRDGFHWHRPDRTPFIGVSERQGDWNWGNVQSAGGGCLVVGDELWFYYSGRAGVPGTSGSGVCATGLAKLRRDGFASLDAGPAGGQVTTRPVLFSGRYLFVNADLDEGELRVEILGPDGEPIAPFTHEACLPLRGSATSQRVRWRGRLDLAELSGRPVRFRFHLRNGRLYAFWVTPDASGASHGYVAAGGPGFTAPTDTVGVPPRR